jgi:hypothetical protein
MILAKTAGLTEVLLAKLKQADGTVVRYYSTSPEIIAHLERNPGVDFLLEASKIGHPLYGADTANYGPQHGDIFCGQIRYDAATSEVICS